MKLKPFHLPAAAVWLLCAALCLLFSVPKTRADTQGLPSTLVACTNLPPVLTSGSVSNCTSIIQLHNDSGLALQAIFGATSNNANVGVFIEPSVDGTNFATTPWVWVVGLNGPTNVVATTNWDYLRLRGYGGDAAQYVGMAQLIYHDLNARCWEGTIPIYDPGWIGGIGPGNTLNVANAYPDWAAMNAPVRGVKWQFGKGGVQGTVTIGPNKKLTPGMVMDRMKAWRLKFQVQALYSSSNSGELQASVDFPDSGYPTSLTEAPTVPTIFVVGPGAQPVTPAAGASVHAGANPPASPPPGYVPAGLSYAGVIQRDVAATANEAAGVWGRATLRALTTPKTATDTGGYTDLILEIVHVDADGNPVQVPSGGIDANNNPIGQIAGSIVMKLSQAFGQNISLQPTLGCDASGNPAYCFVLRSPWVSSPPGGLPANLFT